VGRFSLLANPHADLGLGVQDHRHVLMQGVIHQAADVGHVSGGVLPARLAHQLVLHDLQPDGVGPPRAGGTDLRPRRFREHEVVRQGRQRDALDFCGLRVVSAGPDRAYPVGRRYGFRADPAGTGLNGEVEDA
jgi:hypothetical protein